MPPLPRLKAGGVRSVGAAVLHVAGQLRPVVSDGRPPAAPAPIVTVATGRLSTVCLDAAAVSSALAAWAQAETAGEDWLVPDPDNLTHAAIAAFERAARWLPRPEPE